MTVDTKEPNNTIKKCGIVMPIGPMDNGYSSEHWARVLSILKKAAVNANMQPIPVWENYEIDVIQDTILKNLYESDVVICDLSGLNSNVMLETGLRLSTKKPTIIIHDKENKIPFDLQSINHLFYQKDLEFNSIEIFISDLSRKIKSISKLYDDKKYVPFAEKFEITTASPKEISIPSDELILSALKNLQSNVNTLSNKVSVLSNNYKNNEDSTPEEVITRFNFSSIIPINEILSLLPKDILSDFRGGMEKAVNENGMRDVTLNFAGNPNKFMKFLSDAKFYHEAVRFSRV